MRHEVPEGDRDEEAADGGQREHQPGRRADVLVLDVTDPGGYRQPGGEAEDEEEPDPDPQRPQRPGRHHRDQGEQGGDDDERPDHERPQVPAAVGAVTA